MEQGCKGAGHSGVGHKADTGLCWQTESNLGREREREREKETERERGEYKSDVT